MKVLTHLFLFLAIVISSEDINFPFVRPQEYQTSFYYSNLVVHFNAYWHLMPDGYQQAIGFALEFKGRGYVSIGWNSPGVFFSFKKVDGFLGLC